MINGQILWCLQNSYDSVSSYDSYNQRSFPNIHDDLKTYSSDRVGTRDRDRERERNAHDPYRFTRSTQQPIKHASDPTSKTSSKQSDYPLYR